MTNKELDKEIENIIDTASEIKWIKTFIERLSKLISVVIVTAISLFLSLFILMILSIFIYNNTILSYNLGYLFIFNYCVILSKYGDIIKGIKNYFHFFNKEFNVLFLFIVFIILCVQFYCIKINYLLGCKLVIIFSLVYVLVGFGLKNRYESGEVNNLVIDIIKNMNINNYIYIQKKLKSSIKIHDILIDFIFYSLIFSTIEEILSKNHNLYFSILDLYFVILSIIVLVFQLLFISMLKPYLMDNQIYFYNLIYDKYNEKIEEKEDQQKQNLHRLNRKRVR